MVNKIKLLENLVSIVNIQTMEIGLLDKKSYAETECYVNKCLDLIRKVYQEIQNQFPKHPIIKDIREHYIHWQDRQVIVPSYGFIG